MDYPYKQGYWETKDHRKIKIKDMETSHIENTIKYLKKNTNFYYKVKAVCASNSNANSAQSSAVSIKATK